MRAGCAALCVAALALVGAACGEDSEKPAVEVTLTVWNRSLFDLEELRTHVTSSYLGAANLLAEPLPDEARVEIAFTSGDYVTVIRRKVDAGIRVAFTTAWGLDVPDEGWVLEVLQEQFRLTRSSDAP